jgi:hypothetical protein
MLKQFFISMSVNSARIFTSMLHVSLNILALFTSIAASILNILVKSLCNRACVLTAQQIPYIPESVSLNKLFPEDCLDCTTGYHGQ